MSINLTTIANLPDDIERKVLHFGFLQNHTDFSYLEMWRRDLLQFDNLLKLNYNGFLVRPIEGDTVISINTKKTESGSYSDSQFDFSIEMQDDEIATIEKYRNKKGILIVVTSLYLYVIGNFHEPLEYTYKENTSTLKISCSGDTRLKPLRRKRSPF